MQNIAASFVKLFNLWCPQVSIWSCVENEGSHKENFSVRASDILSKNASRDKDLDSIQAWKCMLFSYLFARCSNSQPLLIKVLLCSLTNKFCYVMLLLFLPSVLWCCWSGGRKGIRLVKNWVVGCWRGYLSGARCRLAHSPADATATHCLGASVKSRLVYPFWYRPTWVVPEKGPLNGCVCVCVLGLASISFWDRCL